MRGLFTLVLGENTIDDTAMMQQQMSMGMQAPEASKAYTMAKENLDLVMYRWFMPDMEGSCVNLLKQKVG